MTRVIVHIDRLVFAGDLPGDPRRIAQALQEALGRALAAPGMPAHLVARGDCARLSGGRVRIAPGAPAASVGARLAQAITAGLAVVIGPTGKE